MKISGDRSPCMFIIFQEMYISWPAVDGHVYVWVNRVINETGGSGVTHWVNRSHRWDQQEAPAHYSEEYTMCLNDSVSSNRREIDGNVSQVWITRVNTADIRETSNQGLTAVKGCHGEGNICHVTKDRHWTALYSPCLVCVHRSPSGVSFPFPWL